MTNLEWQLFFTICNDILGEGSSNAYASKNWCSWTTFGRLAEDAGYWKSGIPTSTYIAETHIKDNSSWNQPFLYQDIAHIIIPKAFFWEIISAQEYKNGTKTQDILLLSKKLGEKNIKHSISEYALDIKLF